MSDNSLDLFSLTKFTCVRQTWNSAHCKVKRDVVITSINFSPITLEEHHHLLFSFHSQNQTRNGFSHHMAFIKEFFPIIYIEFCSLSLPLLRDTHTHTYTCTWYTRIYFTKRHQIRLWWYPMVMRRVSWYSFSISMSSFWAAWFPQTVTRKLSTWNKASSSL